MKHEAFFCLFVFNFLCGCFLICTEAHISHPFSSNIQVGETIAVESFIPRYPKDVQELLVQNVFLTGGNMMYPGMKVRIEKELLEMRPFRSSFQVLIVRVTSCF